MEKKTKGIAEEVNKADCLRVRFYNLGWVFFWGAAIYIFSSGVKINWLSRLLLVVVICWWITNHFANKEIEKLKGESNE